MNRTPLVLALGALLSLPGSASAQSMLDLLQSLRGGGGWVHIPIEAGIGTLRTNPLPTLGLTLRGCAQVYVGHSGRWTIQARDPLGDGEIDVEVAGGEPVHFSYTTGQQAQLTLSARWSEARDTTLLMWVGLETRAGPERDACTPVYGDGPPP